MPLLSHDEIILDLSKDYLYSNTYQKIEDFVPCCGSSLYYGLSPENRSHWFDKQKNEYEKMDVTFIGISDQGNDTISITDDVECHIYNLRSSTDLNDFFSRNTTECIYLDISGLNCRIIASLLRHIHKNELTQKLYVIYCEPEFYKVGQFSSEGVYNDLSERINGINPLPGFASIFPIDDSEFHFIPFLGFEGGRFTHIKEHIQPPGHSIIPIIGVPGYRAEYPFVAYWGNRQPLKETDSWRRVKYAAANSIIDAYLILKRILKKNPSSFFKIAPIGTKPHAIGVILFAIMNPEQTEIIYDNPKRSKQRTDGFGKLIECNISLLLQEE